MTRTFQTNENNDIFIGDDGNLAIITGDNSIIQQTEEAVETLVEEPIYDNNLGVDYENTVFTGSPNLVAFERQARRQILRVAGVVRIISFNLELIDDNVSYTADIETDEGQVSISGGLSV